VRAQVLRGPETIPQVEPAAAGAESFARWRSTNVRRQRQAGWAAALVTLPLGDVTSEQLRALAALARAYGDGAARFTSNQNLLLRWVREGDLPALHERLAAAGLGQHGAEGVLDVVSCPGADSCRLAVTHSRGLGRLLSDHLRAGPRPLALAPDLQIRASGCPNGCARHHVAGIGLQGSVTKVGDRAVPRYFVLIGGSAQGTATHGEAHGEARFARLAGKVPARRVPEAVDRLLALYEAGRRPDESATAFFLRVDLAKAKEALRELSEIDAASARPEDFVDLGEAEEQISPPGTESVA
jgi:sulfite reductase (NADPH) hemoprotein beta-component